MKNKLAKLIDVKSIVTLCLTLVFCVMSLMSVVPQEFLAIYTMIIGFYFGTQANKNSERVAATYAEAQQAEYAQEATEVIRETAADGVEQNDVHPPDVVVTGFGVSVNA